MTMLLKGAPVAEAITAELKERAEKLAVRGVVPTLAILRVGDRPDDLSYERGAMRRAEKAGIRVAQFTLPADCTKAQLLDAVEKINKDEGIHGCLMFRPLPDGDMERAACAALDPQKDADGMTAVSMAGVFTGKPLGFAPCTAQACMEILHHYGIDVKGMDAVILGRSSVIGAPVSMMLMHENATVTICHTKTRNTPEKAAKADLLIAATGRGRSVNGSYTNPDQIILDVGISCGEDGSIYGDVDAAEVLERVQALSPVPGGVGSVTTAVLCKHVIEAAERAAE